MKYLDKNGKIHPNRGTVIASNLSSRFNKVLERVPGYAETADMEEEPIMDHDVQVDDEPTPDEEVTENPVQEDEPVEDMEAPPEMEGMEEPVLEEESSVEEPKQSGRVRINYQEGTLELVNEEGAVTATSELDPKLVDTTIQKDVIDVLYGNTKGNVKFYKCKCGRSNSMNPMNQCGVCHTKTDIPVYE